jgi:alpha-1,6-mannosyltransferase
VHVHISNLAAQTGASLFLQIHSPPYTDVLATPPSSHWTYNKTESLSPSFLTSSPQITHLIVESNADMQFFIKNEWVLVDSVQGFDGWMKPTREAVKKAWRGVVSGEKEHGIWDLVPRMETRKKLWIMERKGWAA